MWTFWSQGPPFRFTQQILMTPEPTNSADSASDIVRLTEAVEPEKNENYFCWVSETLENPKQRLREMLELHFSLMSS